jgi:hypothetical protein
MTLVIDWAHEQIFSNILKEHKKNDRHINYSEAKPKAYQSYSDPVLALYLALHLAEARFTPNSMPNNQSLTALLFYYIVYQTYKTFSFRYFTLNENES